MGNLMAHLTAFEMSSHLVIFALGCLVGAAAAIGFLRRSGNASRR